jgi:hypothetical protein
MADPIARPPTRTGEAGLVMPGYPLSLLMCYSDDADPVFARDRIGRGRSDY